MVGCITITIPFSWGQMVLILQWTYRKRGVFVINCCWLICAREVNEDNCPKGQEEEFKFYKV